MRKSIKKLITIILMTTLFIGVGIKDIKAVTATASLEASKTKTKAGETFTVTLKAASQQGLNGIITEVQYDNQKLELTSATAGENWSNLSSGTKLDLIYNSPEMATNSNVYSMTFKVKEGATGEAEIKTGAITIDTMESGNNSMVTENAKIVKVTIESTQGSQDSEEKQLSSIEIAKNPSKTIYSEGDKFDKTGMTIIAKYTDGSSKEVTNYTYSPSGNLKTTDKKIAISYTEGDITKTATIEITVKATGNGGTGGNDGSGSSSGAGTNTGTGSSSGSSNESGNSKDPTVAGKDYPKTGAERIILPMAIVATLGTVGFIGYKKFSKI